MNHNNNLKTAIQLLKEQELTCALVKGENIYTSRDRGIKPLLDCYKGEKMVSGNSAADKVVGRAAAFLYVLLGTEELYAEVLSRPALDVLMKAGIPVTYGTLVDAIINRTGDGFCPMETAVLDIIDANEALKAVEKTLEKLQGK